MGFCVTALHRYKIKAGKPDKTMNEKRIEKKLREAVKKMGGECLKFTSPGRAGVADRLVLMPGERMWFVETKTTGKTLDPLQELFRKQVTGLGFRHRIVDNPERLTNFLTELRDEI